MFERIRSCTHPFFPSPTLCLWGMARYHGGPRMPGGDFQTPPTRPINLSDVTIRNRPNPLPRGSTHQVDPHTTLPPNRGSHTFVHYHVLWPVTQRCGALRLVLYVPGLLVNHRPPRGEISGTPRMQFRLHRALRESFTARYHHSWLIESSLG